jgi:NodT family efflux transporter outer membrane factor (OMF) lipoprotein
MHGSTDKALGFARTRRRWPCGTLLAATLLFCGCTSPREYVRNGFKVGPNYAKPAAPVEEKWIDTGKDERLKSRTPENVEWWTSLNDPVLNELVKRAYKENLTLRQAAYRVMEFRAQRAIAAGNLFPQTQQAQASYTANATSGAVASLAGLPGTFPLVRFFNTWDGGFNLAWELDFWGRLRRAVESADASLDASIEDYDNALVTLIGNVASTYVNIRTFQERIKLANDNRALQKVTFDIAEARFKAGQKDKIDFYQAVTNLAQVESLIPQLEIGQRQAENQLCILLGMPPQDLQQLLGTAPIPTAEPELVVGIPAELLRRRPDVLSAERQAAAQSAQIGIAQAELYPHISITGTISWQASSFHDLFNGKALAGSVGPGFAWNLLNYGRLVNGVRVQDARFQQLVMSYQSTVLKAESEVENGITSFLKSHQVVNKLTIGASASEEGAKLGAIQFKEGKIAFVTLALLQQNQLTAQDNLATAKGNLVLGLVQTYQALGGGWQIRLQDNGPEPVDAAAPPKQMPAVNPKELPMSRLPGPVQGPATTLRIADSPTEGEVRARIDVANVH